MSSTNVRIFGTAPDSIVDGPGLRYAIFVQGCSHGCPGCHNRESQPAEGGELRTVDDIIAEVKANKLVHDVTLSGGEPFEQPAACAEIASRLKADGYGIWAYTGYLFEDLEHMGQTDSAIEDMLEHIDVLVDGPFVESKKSLGLQWRGSSNQRLIDVKATRTARREDPTASVVLWRQTIDLPEKPSNW